MRLLREVAREQWLALLHGLGGGWVAAIPASLALSVSMALMLYLLAYWRTEETEG